MTDVKTTLVALENTLKSLTKRPVRILDTNPTAIDKDVLYIVGPAPNDVNIKHQMSTSSTITFPIHIYAIVHVKDVSRQRDIGENVYESFSEADRVMDLIHNRARNWRKIADMNVSGYKYGTASWVVNTKVFTAYEIIFTVKGFIDD